MTASSRRNYAVPPLIYAVPPLIYAVFLRHAGAMPTAP